ncbi:MAG: hypothetical protein HY928_15650 [Elusimicrobia bacterium]|nr:hypothetical protein [Elusimicrobiota bacterium]
MTRTRILVAVAAALALAGCSHQRMKVGKTEDGEVIEAEGWSPIDAADLLATKKRSLAEAQKKAVERVVGVYISAKTRVAQAVSLDQNILANVGGYIKKYDVLSEKQEDGFYKTVIRAHVLYKKVGDDLNGLGLIRPDAPPGNPKVMVVLAGEAGADRAESPAAGAVRKVLVDRGFQVVDPAELERKGLVRGADAKALLGAGKALGADLVVTGLSSARELTDVRLGGFRSWRSRVEIQAMRAATAEVVSRRTQEASGLDPDGDIARAKALENAGTLAAESLAAELSQVLSKRVTVSLRVSGLKGGLATVQRLAEELRLQPDIAQAVLEGYGDGVAEIKVTTEGFTGDELAALLVRLKKYSFTMKSVTPYLVEADID